MSFILDALKKSEADRQRQAGPALLEMRVMPVQRRLPLWAIVVGVLLLVNVVALGWFALHRTSADVSSAASPATAAVPGAAPGIAPGSPAMSAAPSASAPAWGAQGAAAAPIQNDYQEPQSASAEGNGGTGSQGPAAEADNPADLAPAVNSAPATVRPARSSELQSYVELSGKLPELRLDLHVYAAKPAERYAFINMHKMREGDVTPEGVRVLEIISDGVVLDYRGTQFLLGHQ